jgi:hypothetical protein
MPNIFSPFTYPNAVELPADPIHYKIADNLSERKAAFRLLYEAYVGARLMLPNPHEMRVMPHHLLPTTTLLIALQREQVVATVSLIGDGRLGLPIERIYADEIDQRRDPSRWLGEVSSLASRRLSASSRLDVFVNLMRLMAQHARRSGLDHLMAAVHPRHARFYQRRLGFETFGSEKAYPAVRNMPAVPLFLDFAQLEREEHQNYGVFFGQPLCETKLIGWPISSAERRFFAPAAMEWSCEGHGHVVEAPWPSTETAFTACA